jgi:hypothetical protein
MTKLLIYNKIWDNNKKKKVRDNREILNTLKRQSLFDK